MRGIPLLLLSVQGCVPVVLSIRLRECRYEIGALQAHDAGHGAHEYARLKEGDIAHVEDVVRRIRFKDDAPLVDLLHVPGDIQSVEGQSDHQRNQKELRTDVVWIDLCDDHVSLQTNNIYHTCLMDRQTDRDAAVE